MFFLNHSNYRFTGAVAREGNNMRGLQKCTRYHVVKKYAGILYDKTKYLSKDINDVYRGKLQVMFLKFGFLLRKYNKVKGDMM